MGRWNRRPPCAVSPTCSSGRAPSPTRCGPSATQPPPSTPFRRSSWRQWARPASRRSPGWARPAPRSSWKPLAEGPRPTSRSSKRWRPPALSAEGQALRRRLQGDCHSHSDWSDGGSPIDEMAEAARDLGHRYWALTDHSPRLTVAHGLDPERLRQQLAVVARTQRRAGSVPYPDRDRSRHPGGRTARPGGGAARRAGCGGGQRAFQAAHGLGRHDGPHAARPSRTRTPTSSGTAPVACWSGTAVPRPPSTPTRCSMPALPPARRSRSTRDRSGSTHPSRSSPWPVGSVAWWWWTPMPTPPASSNGSATVANRRRGSGSRWTGS